jgi:cytochrome c oxidase subunit 4
MEHIVSAKTYFLIFGILMVLTATTIGVAFLNLGPLNNVIMLTIAMSKAMLVALYFMHLRYSDRLLSLFAGGAILWLLILITLTMADYLTRTWLPLPVGMPG